MRRRTLCRLSATALLLWGSMVAAQSDADYSRPGPYVGLGFAYGKEAFDVSDAEDALSDDISAVAAAQPECQPGTRGTNQECETHLLLDRTDSLGADFRAGYRINSWAAVEVNFQYFNKFDLKLGGPTKDFGNVRLYDFFVQGKFYAPFGGPLQPYFLGGIGGVYGDIETRGGVVATANFDYAEGKRAVGSVTSVAGSDGRAVFAGRFGGGLDYYITRNIVLNLDISYTLTTDYDVEGLPDDIRLTHVPITTALQYRFN